MGSSSFNFYVNAVGKLPDRAWLEFLILSARSKRHGPTKVNLLWVNPDLRSYSPNALVETGLRMCPPEKRRDGDPFADEQSVL